MKKEEQKAINELCKSKLAAALDELNANTKSKRLLSCSAYVFDTEHYYILKSYDTFIACIEKSTDTLYDALRVVYGYTATSAKHISKFNHGKVYGGYSSGTYGCKAAYTAR